LGIPKRLKKDPVRFKKVPVRFKIVLGGIPETPEAFGEHFCPFLGIPKGSRRTPSDSKRFPSDSK